MIFVINICSLEAVLKLRKTIFGHLIAPHLSYFVTEVIDSPLLFVTNYDIRFI